MYQCRADHAQHDRVVGLPEHATCRNRGNRPLQETTPAQKALLLSASKEPGKYTEGVVLSKNIETLFRIVPPSLYLALAMTEPEEKAERWRLMQAHHCSELETAFRMAERIDETRGIGP